ncbi:reverse transcriptase (RNA-dependent DNA polymerase) domain-containing protein [Phthorimaea operculella]|nr:reverse transcriptase (RNA-dependent DNA polymerase) domain-containing protein [Phthorimaea operculella]
MLAIIRLYNYLTLALMRGLQVVRQAMDKHPYWSGHDPLKYFPLVKVAKMVETLPRTDHAALVNRKVARETALAYEIAKQQREDVAVSTETLSQGAMRLMHHINSINLLNPQQYAYQRGRSTVDAARDVTERVMSHIEGGRQVAAIFCDLSRAFELVDHSLLLKKLTRYGVSGVAHAFVTSFLKIENRPPMCGTTLPIPLNCPIVQSRKDP